MWMTSRASVVRGAAFVCLEAYGGLPLLGSCRAVHGCRGAEEQRSRGAGERVKNENICDLGFAIWDWGPDFKSKIANRKSQMGWRGAGTLRL